MKAAIRGAIGLFVIGVAIVYFTVDTALKEYDRCRRS